jgi:hypothetical protein
MALPFGYTGAADRWLCADLPAGAVLRPEYRPFPEPGYGGRVGRRTSDAQPLRLRAEQPARAHQADLQQRRSEAAACAWIFSDLHHLTPSGAMCYRLPTDDERDEYTTLTGTESRQPAEMPAPKVSLNGPGSRGPKPSSLGA